MDILIDIRIGSSTYGKSERFLLSEENKVQLFIPVGYAHGFLSLVENSTLCYLTSKENHRDFDKGISIPDLEKFLENENLIISDRDKQHPSLEDYISPFLF